MSSDTELDRDGFRLRGRGVTRLEGFIDAAFAFAVTLLVISIDDVPSSYPEMIAALSGAPAFALSFAMLFLFWRGHWLWSRRFGLEDPPSTVLSAMLVFTVLIYVYPLKYMFSLLTAWLSDGRLGGSARIDSMAQLHDVFLVYGIGFTAMSLLITLLNVHALRNARALDLTEAETLITRTEVHVWSVLVGAGVLSTALAAIAPPTPLVLPGWTYMIIPVGTFLVSHRYERQRRELESRVKTDDAA